MTKILLLLIKIKKKEKIKKIINLKIIIIKEIKNLNTKILIIKIKIYNNILKRNN